MEWKLIHRFVNPNAFRCFQIAYFSIRMNSNVFIARFSVGMNSNVFNRTYLHRNEFLS